jgi:nitroreductase/NAD-dependent dihydropyrimidine dehydrogenase PreA subunit
MIPLRIDKSRCVGCGSCVDVCPYDALKLIEGKAVYQLESCFLCGHCRAVCPVDALVIAGFEPQLELKTSPRTEHSSKASNVGDTKTSTLVALMRSRRSCRNYRDTEVALEVLEDLVKIAITAPSGTNSQGWRFTILPTRGDLMVLGAMVADYYRKLNRMARNPLLRCLVKYFTGDSLGRYYRNYYASVSEALYQWDDMGVDRLFHGATAGILVTAKLSSSCPAEDALLATQNILLGAHSMGLGSCLIGFAVEAMKRDSRIIKKMQIPQTEQIYSVIALGFPDVEFLRPADRKVVMPRILAFPNQPA